MNRDSDMDPLLPSSFFTRARAASPSDAATTYRNRVILAPPLPVPFYEGSAVKLR
jgi:hypothetical protein